MTVTEIDALTARLESLPVGDMDAAVYLTRDVHVLARKVFGENSPHVAEVLAVSFRPLDGIYNKEHYKNTGAWKDGSRGLGAILKSMRYEASLMSNPELQPPETVTLPWLFHHLSWQVWLTFFGLLLSSFTVGVVAAHIPFFMQIYDIITHQPRQ